MRLIKQYSALKECANENYWINKLPKNHVRCGGYDYDEDADSLITNCDKIITKEELDEKGWYRGKYICGHFNDSYYCPKHKEDAKRREEDTREECGWCEQK